MGRAALILGVALLPMGSGCTWNASQPLYDGPALAPLKVSITSDPAPAADGSVTRQAQIILTFDDYPDPESAFFGPVQVRSGAATFDVDVRVSLIDRAIVVTPRSPLIANTNYEVVAEAGIRSLSGRVLTTTVTQALHAGFDEGTAPAPPPALTWMKDIAADIATCSPNCHSPIGASGDTRTPTRLLDLTGDPTNGTYGLIGVAAVGEREFPVPLLRVAPGDSARSVLLRKLLGGDPHADSLDTIDGTPLYPAMGVDGRRMPIPLDESAPVGPPLSDDAIRRVQNWIDEGAPVS
jgi:hypothetical protein